MLEMFKLKIRSILELACPVWHSAITVKENNDIERVQKIALRIILGDSYHSYRAALIELGLEKLKERHSKQCQKFALNFSQDKRHKDKFILMKKRTRSSKKRKFYQPYARTVRYRKSAVPNFIKLLNQN